MGSGRLRTDVCHTELNLDLLLGSTKPTSEVFLSHDLPLFLTESLVRGLLKPKKSPFYFSVPNLVYTGM